MDSLSWTFSGAKNNHRCKGITETDNADYWNPSSISLYRRQNCSLSEHPNLKECPFQECYLGESKNCPYGHIYDTSSSSYTAIQRVGYYFLFFFV
uniref:Uncharacterized protein n=1 Tax=Panagrolaimus sp. PS1159 TaxID=55785 RepID=A0AC35FY81_9BILA